jgi:hypothetical protein
MKFTRSHSLRIGAAALGLAAAALAPVAHAGDVNWSVGIAAAPGVSVGLSNTRPIVLAPQPVYVQPQPVYVQPNAYYVTPAPVYMAPRVVYSAPPVYVQPMPVYGAAYYGPPGHRRHHWKHGHGHR